MHVCVRESVCVCVLFFCDSMHSRVAAATSLRGVALHVFATCAHARDGSLPQGRGAPEDTSVAQSEDTSVAQSPEDTSVALSGL